MGQEHSSAEAAQAYDDPKDRSDEGATVAATMPTGSWGPRDPVAPFVGTGVRGQIYEGKFTRSEVVVRATDLVEHGVGVRVRRTPSSPRSPRNLQRRVRPACVRPMRRRRGAGRPSARRVSRSSSAASGDSGSGEPGEPEPHRALTDHARRLDLDRLAQGVVA